MTRFFRPLPRYTIAAIFCALLNNVVLIGCAALGWGIFACQMASALVLLPTGYFLQSRFAFRVERTWSAFWRYSAALITNFPLAIVLLWLMHDAKQWPMFIAAPVSTILLFAWNFVTSSWALLPDIIGAKPNRF